MRGNDAWYTPVGLLSCLASWWRHQSHPFTGDPVFGASNGLLLSDHDIDEPNRSPDTKKSQVGGFLQGERIRMRFNLVKSIRTPARASQKGS
jgi:hypothetical protein